MTSNLSLVYTAPQQGATIEIMIRWAPMWKLFFILSVFWKLLLCVKPRGGCVVAFVFPYDNSSSSTELTKTWTIAFPLLLLEDLILSDL